MNSFPEFKIVKQRFSPQHAVNAGWGAPSMSEDIARFEAEVSKYLRMGYEVSGPMLIHDCFFLQPLVKPLRAIGQGQSQDLKL